MYKKIFTSVITLICMFGLNNIGYCESYIDSFANVFGGRLMQKYPNAKHSRVQCEKLVEEYFRSFSTLTQDCYTVYVNGRKSRVCSGYDADQLGLSSYYKRLYCDPNYAKKLAAQEKENQKRKLEREKQQKLQHQKYLQEHAKLVKEIDDYKMSLPNLDFKVHNKYKSSYNTLIKDTYTVFTSPKNKFDIIPEGALFDANLQGIVIPNGYNVDYYLANSKHPVFRKYSVAQSLIDVNKDKCYYRHTFISENLYKNSELKPPKGNTYRFEPQSIYGKIELSEVRDWFGKYKQTLVPYLAEYQKVKSEMAKVEQEELTKYRQDLIAESQKIQKKYPDKTIGNFISSKQKLKLSTKYTKNNLFSKLTEEQLYGLKMGYCYLLNGKEIELSKLSNSDIKKKNYLFIDKTVIKELKDLSKINTDKEVDFSYYMTGIQDRIKNNWHPSETLPSNIVVVFKIAKNGSLLDLSVKKSSGNEQCDKDALFAVWRSFPFWPLPKNYIDTEISIEFTFSATNQTKQEYKIIPLN